MPVSDEATSGLRRTRRERHRHLPARRFLAVPPELLLVLAGLAIVVAQALGLLGPLPIDWGAEDHR